MNNKNKLNYLIQGLRNGTYDISSFCDEYYKVYNFEIDDSEFTHVEQENYRVLEEIIARFSPFEEDLQAYPGMYYCEDEIRDAVEELVEKLGI